MIHRTLGRLTLSAAVLGAALGVRARAEGVPTSTAAADTVQFTCETRSPMPKSDPDMGAWDGPSGSNVSRQENNGAPVDAAIVTRAGDPIDSYSVRTIERGATSYDDLKLRAAEGKTKVYVGDRFRVAVRFVPYQAAHDVAVELGAAPQYRDDSGRVAFSRDTERTGIAVLHLGQERFAHYEALIETKDGAPFTTCRRPASDGNKYSHSDPLEKQ